jgi:hypothetical protein
MSCSAAAPAATSASSKPGNPRSSHRQGIDCDAFVTPARGQKRLFVARR